MRAFLSKVLQIVESMLVVLLAALIVSMAVGLVLLLLGRIGCVLLGWQHC